MTFFDPQETRQIEQFERDGYLSFDLDDRDRFDDLRNRFRTWAEELLQKRPDNLFDQTADHVSVAELNEFRLGLIRRAMADDTLRPLLYRLARQPLHLLVGNELAMQRGLGLSIQLPDDDSSLLALHSDVWSGNSPYEVVFWLPLTAVHDTRSMYLLPKPATDRVYHDFERYRNLSAEAFFNEIRDDLQWVRLEPGQGLIFWHGLIHGNRVNREAAARWSLNVRFKGLLTPYGTKELGESFLPITTRAMTRIGYQNREPR